MCVCTCQQSDAILLQQCVSLFVRARVCVSLIDLHTRKAARWAQRLLSVQSSTLNCFSSPLFTSPLLQLSFSLFSFTSLTSASISSVSSLSSSSPLSPPLRYRWLYLYAAGFHFFFSLPLSSSPSLTLDSLSISPFMTPGPLSSFFFFL